MNQKLLGYLRLMRPANLPTAAADILAGVAIAHSLANLSVDALEGYRLVCLIGSTVALYAGGVVLNDVFDAKLDAVERPERPIPSGLIPLRNAAVLGILLLVAGVLFAGLVNTLSGMLAFGLALSILLYDAIAKNHGVLGPFTMGICRGLNLLLGMSVLGELKFPLLAIIPVVYIYAITLISRGEVHGNNKSHIIWAGVLYAVVLLAALGSLPFLGYGLPFALLLAFLIYYPLVQAYRNNTPKNIKKAVISGVLSIVVLDAVLASGFYTWWYGVLLLLLLPLSLLLSRLFAVT